MLSALIVFQLDHSDVTCDNGFTIEPQMANLAVDTHISDLMGHYEWHDLSALKRRRSAAKKAVQ